MGVVLWRQPVQRRQTPTAAQVRGQGTGATNMQRGILLYSALSACTACIARALPAASGYWAGSAAFELELAEARAEAQVRGQDGWMDGFYSPRHRTRCVGR
jgi:hypothetical protein